MSKGLERLEIIKLRLSNNATNKECLKIIEKELKEKQEQDEILTHYGLSSKDLAEACKHLKAIKNGDFGLFFEDYENQKQALEVIKDIWGDNILTDIEKGFVLGQPYIKLPDKEKCDLLKEVLL